MAATLRPGQAAAVIALMLRTAAAAFAWAWLVTGPAPHRATPSAGW
jgi:hypothetical protein